MTKFQIGDRVRLANTDQPHTERLTPGSEGIVVDALDVADAPPDLLAIVEAVTNLNLTAEGQALTVQWDEPQEGDINMILRTGDSTYAVVPSDLEKVNA